MFEYIKKWFAINILANASVLAKQPQPTFAKEKKFYIELIGYVDMLPFLAHASNIFS